MPRSTAMRRPHRGPGLATLIVLLFCPLAAQGQSVTIAMSKDVYELGEPLQLSITNGLEQSIYMNFDPPWSIVRVSSDSTVAPCYWLQWIVWAAPGQTLDYEYSHFECDTGLPVSLEP